MARIRREDKQRIEEVRDRKNRVLETVLTILDTICKDNTDIFKKPIESRLKSFSSIRTKIADTKGCDFTNFEKFITDIAGARLTVCTIDEIPKAEELISNHHEVKKCVVCRSYDQGADQDGYRGHHLEVTVDVFYRNKTITDTCEIQIRTLAGDLWAVLSHRDFYKSVSKIPPLVRKDMRTLSKQLEVVDDMALSLRQRRSEESDRVAKRKAERKAKKALPDKDMLTVKNVTNLVHKVYKRRISADLAYKLVQFILKNDVTSLKKYETLITSVKYRSMIERIFQDFGVTPRLIDRLYFPTLIDAIGESRARMILMKTAKRMRDETKRAVEKGIEISDEELRRETRTSQPNTQKETS